MTGHRDLSGRTSSGHLEGSPPIGGDPLSGVPASPEANDVLRGLDRIAAFLDATPAAVAAAAERGHVPIFRDSRGFICASRSALLARSIRDSRPSQRTGATTRRP